MHYNKLFVINKQMLKYETNIPNAYKTGNKLRLRSILDPLLSYSLDAIKVKLKTLPTREKT